MSSCKKNELRVIVKKNENLCIDEDVVNTYGLTNEEILYRIFNLHSVRDLTVQEEIDKYKELFTRGELITEEEKEQMKNLKEKLEKTAGLSRSDIAMLEFESNTNKYREIFKKLGDKKCIR